MSLIIQTNLKTHAHLLVVLIDVAVSEVLATQLALVGFVLAVDDLVSRHLVQALEGAAADLAGVRSLLWPQTDRDILVKTKKDRGDAGTPAVERQMLKVLTRVCDHVAFELICRNELLVAGVALEYLVDLEQEENRFSPHFFICIK